MVKVYESEQEQIDAIKTWWKDNAVSVVLGVVIGVSGIFAWNGWQQHKVQTNQAASAYYLQIADHLQEGNYDIISGLADKVIDEYGATAYASLSQISAAKAAFSNGDLEQSESRLEWVVNNGATDYFRSIATLRLAALQQTLNKYDAAEKTLSAPVSQAFEAQRQSLKGDLALLKGDFTQAKSSYNAALSEEVGVANPQILQYKLNNLPVADSSETEPKTLSK